MKTRASSPAGGGKTAYATYTGDGAATQAIVGVGFRPRFVQILERTNNDATVKFACAITEDGGNTLLMQNFPSTTFYELDHVISFDADGFTVGDGTGGVGNQLNKAGIDYNYICFG
ncbi:hypothetical protein MUO79_07660 [Candidatus Bathyarchaeota archaeon]|nr:hypothetical protein [Candidatus Bathyarchaeota archaeon]